MGSDYAKDLAMHPRRNPEIETKLLPDGHAVLFSKQTNWAHTITPLAAVAWEFCDGNHSMDEISSQVAEIAADPNFSVDLKTVVNDLIRELTDAGLLQEDSL
jgi:hypothetical protein